jgi:hypothetical protein
LTTEALRRIAELYVIEEEIRGKPPDERRQIRQARARPLVNDLEHWLRTTLDTLSSKSDTAAAILYALKLWPALLRYCDDGAAEIDNSAAERALRGMAIGRRNYLFAGADSGGERAAAIYSLIGTAKLNGVDPEAWLRHVLANIAYPAIAGAFPIKSRCSVLSRASTTTSSEFQGILLPRKRTFEKNFSNHCSI